MKQKQIKQWSLKMIDSSKTVLGYKGTAYRYNHNTLTFERTHEGCITGRYPSLSEAMKGVKPLTEAEVAQGMQQRATELVQFVPDTLVRSILDRFSTFENGLRILFNQIQNQRTA